MTEFDLLKMASDLRTKFLDLDHCSSSPNKINGLPRSRSNTSVLVACPPKIEKDNSNQWVECFRRTSNEHPILRMGGRPYGWPPHTGAFAVLNLISNVVLTEITKDLGGAVLSWQGYGAAVLGDGP
jgi:hypothetical protein